MLRETWVDSSSVGCLHVQRLAQAVAKVAVDEAAVGRRGEVAIFEGANLFALLDEDRRSGVSVGRLPHS